MIGAHLGAFYDDPQVHLNLFHENYNSTFTRIVDRDRDNLFFSSLYEKGWKEPLRSVILNRIASEFDFVGYDRVIMKSPNESHASDIILKCLPKSKLIF